MAHWVSEFNRTELPQVITEVHEVTDSNTKILVKHRHATTISWNFKSFCNNNNVSRRAPPLSHYHRSTSRTYLYVQNHEELIQHNGVSDGIKTIQIKNQHAKEKHFVEVRKKVKNYSSSPNLTCSFAGNVQPLNNKI